LVSAAGDVIQGFDVRSGERLWSVYAQGEGVVPSVVVGDDLVYSASGFEASTIRAVKPDGRGDVTGTHVAWEQTKGVPRIPSFLFRKPYLFTITEAGIAMCLRAETGEIVWQQRVGGEHSASPVWSDRLIYFLSDQGETTIIRAAPEYEEVARNSIGEPCQASIAISQGNLFLRSNTHLFCIGNTP
jgi:outer membrane protein assembly factor BamB